jgi:hypothetical protein
MVFHGYTPSQLTACTTIPKPKGHNAEEANRITKEQIAISLRSIVGKITDLIIINR